MLNRRIEYRLNAHDIGFEGALAANTDVLPGTALFLWLTFAGNIVPGHRALSANFAFSGHKESPCSNSRPEEYHKRGCCVKSCKSSLDVLQ